MISIGLLQQLDRLSMLEKDRSSICSRLKNIPFIALLGPVLYISILLFNLAVTIWIGESFLALVGCLILLFPTILGIFFTAYKLQYLSEAQIEAHLSDFPASEITQVQFPAGVASASRH